jgi:benzoylformate decarboxylase
MDVMEEMSSASILRPSTIDRTPIGGSLEQLADYLVATPLGKVAIIAGDEITGSGAAFEVVALAEALGAPVYGSSWPARIPYPTAHPQWLGNLPPKASEIANILQNYDCIFALGGKSLITILYTEESAVPQGCEVYQLSSDVRDLGRTYPSKLSIVGDIKGSLQVLVPMLKDKLKPAAHGIASLRQAHKARDEMRRADLSARADNDLSLPVISPLLAAREIAKAIGSKVPIIDEAIATASHLRGFLNSNTCPQYSFLRGGALGWGMPAAVGFSLGHGRTPVVSLVGDGAALYSPQAIWTAAHEKLPVTFIIINNREYNVLKNFMRGQANYLSTRANQFIAMDITDPPIDYLAMAQSWGVPGVSITKAGDIAGAIEAGIKSCQANLIEIIISA